MHIVHSTIRKANCLSKIGHSELKKSLFKEQKGGSGLRKGLFNVQMGILGLWKGKTDVKKLNPDSRKANFNCKSAFTGCWIDENEFRNAV